MQVSQLPERIQAIARKLTGRGGADSAAHLNDRSYQDGLLDVQVRTFLDAEYGSKEPSSDVYARLMHTVRLHNQRETRHTSVWARFTGVLSRLGPGLGGALATIYRAGSRAETGRLISGTVVAVLLVLAVTPDVMQTLNGRGSLSRTAHLIGAVGDLHVIESDAGPTGQVFSSTLAVEKQQELLEQKMSAHFDAPPVQYQDPNELHPVERGMAPRKPIQPQPEVEHPRIAILQQ